jgi:hypothetical protein
MTASWPGTLPQVFLRDDYSEKSAENIIASEMSIGPAKLRRRSTAGVSSIGGSMFMTSDQYAAFKTFVSSTIFDRAAAFTFPDPVSGADILVRMTNPYSATRLGIDWKVAFQLEVLP